MLLTYIAFFTPHSLQQDRCWFIIRVLRHEFTAEGLGEQRRGELFDLSTGDSIACLQPVSKGEKGFDAADDFVLFGERGERKFHIGKSSRT